MVGKGKNACIGAAMGEYKDAVCGDVAGEVDGQASAIAAVEIHLHFMAAQGDVIGAAVVDFQCFIVAAAFYVFRKIQRGGGGEAGACNQAGQRQVNRSY